jgi:hypothetical protein
MAPSGYRQVVFYLAVAGIRLGNPLRGLLLFTGHYCSGKINRVVGHVHVDGVIAQRGLILQSILNLALEVGSG